MKSKELSTDRNRQSNLPLVRALKPAVAAWREGGYIVLDRLMGDSKNPEFFEGAIFKKFPFIPPEWASDFQLDVIGPDEEQESYPPGNALSFELAEIC